MRSPMRAGQGIKLTLWAIALGAGITWVVRQRGTRLPAPEVAPPVIITNLLPAELVAGSSPPYPTPQMTELTLDEKLEMARLRAEVVRLRERRRELADAPRENERLRLQATMRAAQPASSTVFPSGFVRRATARNRGLDTPQNALESFLWAIEQRDTNVLFGALQPQAAEGVADQFAKQGSEAMFREMARLPGFAVSREEAHDADHVTLWLTWGPEVPEVPTNFERINGEWRLYP